MDSAILLIKWICKKWQKDQVSHFKFKINIEEKWKYRSNCTKENYKSKYFPSIYSQFQQPILIKKLSMKNLRVPFQPQVQTSSLKKINQIYLKIFQRFKSWEKEEFKGNSNNSLFSPCSWYWCFNLGACFLLEQ